MQKRPTLTLVPHSDTRPEWVQLFRPDRKSRPWTWVGLLLLSAAMPLTAPLHTRQKP